MTLKAILQGLLRAIDTYVVRIGERASMSRLWHQPVSKIDHHVSGDHLARKRFEGMPLPNIWEGK